MKFLRGIFIKGKNKIDRFAEFLENGTFKPNKSKNAVNVQPTSKVMYKRLEVFADFQRNTAYNI